MFTVHYVPHSPFYNVHPSLPTLGAHPLPLSTLFTDRVVGPLHCLLLTQHTACTRRVRKHIQLLHAPCLACTCNILRTKEDMH